MNININEKINMHIPTSKELYNYALVKCCTILTMLSVPATHYRDVLENTSIDVDKISDFEFFYLITRIIDSNDTYLLFGDWDLSKLQLMVHKETGEKFLVDIDNDIIIDNETYLEMRESFRMLLNDYWVKLMEQCGEDKKGTENEE